MLNLIILPFLAVVIAVHECAHAWAAFRLGDPTARSEGRLTLNPLKHLDLFGTLFLIIAGFGWGKPVPVNPFNFKNPRRDNALVALAGPFSNIIFAILLALILKAFSLDGILYSIFQALIVLNVTLCVFNLIPVFPLDGFNIVLGFLPDSLASDYLETKKWGIVLLLLIVATPIFDKFISAPVGFILKYLL